MKGDGADHKKNTLMKVAVPKKTKILFSLNLDSPF
jgi:hypothetical protein